MKISNSKKQLAEIIHEKGGWLNGKGFAAQDRNTAVTFFVDKPTRRGGVWDCENFEASGWFDVTEIAIKNWHQTILSRDEYFHLYPEHTETEYKDGVKPTDPAKVEGPSKPTIEQLAADYSNAKDYADRKQEEADAAKADADAKLAELVAAGTALGLDISIAKGDSDA